MKWNFIAILAAVLAVMFVAGPALAQEGRETPVEIVEDVAEVNVTESDQWIIAPQPNEARSDEGAAPQDESGNATGRERPIDSGERPTSDPPEDDTTIGVDDSDAKGEPLIAPAGNQEADLVSGDGKLPYLYIAIPALLGTTVVGAVLRRRH